MRTFIALLALTCLQEGQYIGHQDGNNYTLAWSFVVGQPKEFSWKQHLRIQGEGTALSYSGSDYSMSLKGTFEIVAADPEGTATGNLVMHYQNFQGKFNGDAINVLVEDGKLKKPDGNITKSSQKQLEEMLAPMKIRATKRGQLEFLAPHPLSEIFTGGFWPAMGPILPSKKRIALGDSWLIPLQMKEIKEKNLPGINVDVLFKDVSEAKDRKRARLVVNSRQMVTVGTASVSYDIKDESFFDVAQGECIRDENQGTVTIIGPGYKFESTFSSEFESLPPRER